jgi:hypothetical protein
VVAGVEMSVESDRRDRRGGGPSLQVRMLGPLTIYRDGATLALGRGATDCDPGASSARLLLPHSDRQRAAKSGRSVTWSLLGSFGRAAGPRSGRLSH